MSRRIRGVVMATAAVAIVSLLALLALWRWSYYEKVIRAVPPGSTQEDFDRAVGGGALGDPMYLKENASTHPYGVLKVAMKAPSCQFWIIVSPEYDDEGRITKYESSSYFYLFDDPYDRYPFPY